MKDDPIQGCGISRLWMWRPDHPFSKHCADHDRMYDERHELTKDEIRERERAFRRDVWSLALAERSFGKKLVRCFEAAIATAATAAWGFIRLR